MSVRAYNRGTRVIGRQADERMPEVHARADREAYKAEIDRLRSEIAKLERELARARRGLAAERLKGDQLRERLAAEKKAYEFGIRTLAKRAFPGER